uniref:Uncharacterized protein n=1 Tax=viral metagenome TaxID=1070528 RepID=A0A6M3KU32_9ZZZZ
MDQPPANIVDLYKAQGWNNEASIKADIAAGGWKSKVQAPTPGFSNTSTSGAGFTSTDPAQTIQAAIDALKKANEPAVASYQARIPEVQSAYTQARSQLQASQPSLEQKYQNLLDKIKGQQTADVAAQTNITAGELGKRGLTGSSTLAQQEIQNAISPLNVKYTGLTQETGLAQTDAMRELQNQIANLTPQEQADIFSINQAIGQLQSGAGQAGMTAGLNLYGTNLSAQQAAEQAKADAAQQKIENALAKQELNQPQFATASSGSGIYAIDPNTGKLISTIKGVQNQLGSDPLGLGIGT